MSVAAGQRRHCLPHLLHYFPPEAPVPVFSSWSSPLYTLALHGPSLHNLTQVLLASSLSFFSCKNMRLLDPTSYAVGQHFRFKRRGTYEEPQTSGLAAGVARLFSRHHSETVAHKLRRHLSSVK